MQQYLQVLRRILDEGEDVATGAFLPAENRRPRARCLVGVQYRHDLSAGFPAVTTKSLFWRGVVAELLWFLRGETTLDFLHKHNVHIWDSWAGKFGHAANDIGPGYGEQWRRWEYLEHDSPDTDTNGDRTSILGTWDQVEDVVNGLRIVAADPSDRARRRLVVSAWNAPLVPEMGLAPCHTLWQALPTNGVLHMVCHWRSIDMLFGFPFNIASYALLTRILCAVSGLRPGTLVANIADCHLYDNQLAMVEEQLERVPFESPQFVVSEAVREIAPNLSMTQCLDLDPSMFRLVGYRHRGKLAGEVEIAV